MANAIQRARQELEQTGQGRPNSEAFIQAVMVLTALACGAGGLFLLATTPFWAFGLFVLFLGSFPAYFQINHLRDLRRLSGKAGSEQIEQRALQTFRIEQREDQERREAEHDNLAGRLSIEDAASDRGDLSLAREPSELSLVEKESN